MRGETVSNPEVMGDPVQFQGRILELKRAGKRVGVVPTMGALHEGHRALMAAGRPLCDILTTTIFVNPKQFAPHEDLDRYPRRFEADVQMCAEEGVDFVFAPNVEAMYPKGYSTYVTVEGMTEELCGRARPIHFRGVTTVCAKLFLITQADVAIFGWKDAQQQLVLRRMVQDLNIPVEIVGVETVREADGLAMSSRNIYLSERDRAEAPVLRRALEDARRRIEAGETRADFVRSGVIDQIERASHGRVDYVQIVSMDEIRPLDEVRRGNTLIAAAVWWGQTRLIDNIRL
jgi:pantoate--beta-alanine ligase